MRKKLIGIICALFLGLGGFAGGMVFANAYKNGGSVQAGQQEGSEYAYIFADGADEQCQAFENWLRNGNSKDATDLKSYYYSDTLNMTIAFLKTDNDDEVYMVGISTEQEVPFTTLMTEYNKYSVLETALMTYLHTKTSENYKVNNLFSAEVEFKDLLVKHEAVYRDYIDEQFGDETNFTMVYAVDTGSDMLLEQEQFSVDGDVTDEDPYTHIINHLVAENKLVKA